MSELYDFVERPDLESPVLVLALEGWIDAGYAASAALTAIKAKTELSTVVTFDADELLDHRARRPTIHIAEGINTGLTWPSIEMAVTTDTAGTEALFLTGAEPDHRWKAFSRATVDLALELGVRLVVGIGAYPAPVPHTRPTRLVSTATTVELARQVGFLPGRIDVPAGVQAAIERRCADVGLPAVGLWAQVPHYASAMPFPAASAALIEGLARIADLTFDPGRLEDDARDTRAKLDELVKDSPEHIELVRQLEEQSDALDRGDVDTGMTEVSGDEIAAEFEKFLRDL